MDDIRAKRLAKLAANTPPPKNEDKTPAKPSTEPSKPQTVSQNKELSNKIPEALPTQPAEKRQKAEPSPESLTEWINKQFEYILSVTLNLDNSTPELIFLEGTYTELVEEEQSLDFSKDLIDRAIIERLSEIGHPQPFRYLRSSWTKAQKVKRTLRAKDPLKEQKLEVLHEVERLCSSYGLVAFQIPDMFPNAEITNFCKDIVTNDSNSSDFLLEIINRSNEEGTILDFLNVFVPELCKLLGVLNLNHSEYIKILNIFQLILNVKAVAAVFTQIDGFSVNPTMQPSLFENNTILGPIFRLSPLQDSVSQSNYDFTRELSKMEINNVGESLQAQHKVLLNTLFFIADKIIRGSETSRKGLLQYFATIVNKNHLRRGDHSDFTKLSSNGFMINIGLVLMRLSQPFLDTSFSKIDKIDLNYFNKASLIDLKDETRTNSTTLEADEYFQANKSDTSPNFISDCFYLTITYLHYGIGGAYLFENKLTQKIKQVESSIEQLKNTSNSNNPMSRFAQLQLPRLEKSRTLLKAQKEALVAFFNHKDMQLEVFDFIAGASCFLIRAIDPAHQFPRQPISLPLIPDVIGVENADNTDYFRQKAPIPFKYFPEFVVEGIVNYVQYISRYPSNPLISNPRLTTFVEFSVTFLRCPELIGNPHLKGKLVESLFIGSYPSQDNRPGFMMDIFDTNELVNKNLLYGLLEFYVVVEKTGASSQFYDKFNSRYHIASILEQIWKNQLYQKQLIYQSENNEEFFIRFIARMLNDLTFLLDESLRQLADVHSFQVELDIRSKHGINNLEGTDDEIRNRLASAERQAKSNVGLANKSIDLFGLFTHDVPRAFIKPEIVDRLASMLDYNLDALVGPKCSELKVSDPEKYSFNPRTLLVNISKVFVNLSDEEDFVIAVSKDTRSFKKSIFDRAVHILGKWKLESDEFISKLAKLADRAEIKRVEEEEEEEEMGEIPDEFLDPLMFTLMKDPVLLPTSKVNIDRSTIRAHLLSDSTDPFNRMPLKLEDVVPNEELRLRIEEFKRKSKGNKDTEMADS